jgi:WD40 repeat protein
MILWDVATGDIIRRFEGGHTNWVDDTAYSPDGPYALSGSSDRTMILWDIATGEIIRRFRGHSGRVIGVAFSPDGQTGFSASSDGTVRVWSLFERGDETG